ncbi:hypothetical protein ACHAXT_010357 [Thalassiosira profunda]
MKRAVAEPADGRCLKRANSSLFSIATLVDDEPNGPDALAGLMGAGGPQDNLLLVDDGDVKEEKDTYSSLKASGLVPLDCSDDDGNNGEDAPEDGVSTSCSSSVIDGQEDNTDAICKSSGARKVSNVSDIAADKAAASLPSEPPTSHELECKRELQASKPSDHRTGLIFEAGAKHFDRHNKFHKERSVRVTSVRDYLAKAEPSDGEKTIFEQCNLLEGSGEKEDEAKRSPEELWLDDHDYLRVHLPGYMQRLDRISQCNCHHRLDIEAEQFKSIYFTNDSVREAKTAASSLCNLVSRVVNGDLDNGFAVIRPPGHHAEPGLAGGYCVINNVAVAAAYAQEKLGMKVLIVDWDVHHGNGTQRCFIDNPNVLYFSAHRYHGGNFFPFQQQGGPSFAGMADGEGFNINVGWNDKAIGDDEYLVLWEKLLMPVAQEFDPDLILVSAGFDAARGDMGECDVTPECFARLARRLKTLANGKVVCALEGGYVRSVLCKCIESVLASLLDADSNEKCKEELARFHKNVGDLEMLDCINESAAKSIRETLKVHAKYWNCLKSEN